MNQPLSRFLTLAAIGAVVAVCAATGLARPAEPHAVLTQASGDLTIANSLNGQALFQASGLAPGRSVTGTVQLSNNSALAGDLSLAQVDVQDTPGTNGGRLSDALHLDIADVTGGDNVPVFAGPLSSVGNRPVGALGPGKGRRFRFTASLPDNGQPPTATGGDNAYAGSALSAQYAWTATASEGGGGLIGPSEISVRLPRMKFRVDARSALTRGWLDVFASCDRGCTLKVAAKAPRKTHVKIRQRIATLPLPGTTARLRLKLTKRSRPALAHALRHRKRVVLRVTVRLVAAGWGETIPYKKNVSVRPPKRR
jgi:hypothetical protein